MVVLVYERLALRVRGVDDPLATLIDPDPTNTGPFAAWGVQVAVSDCTETPLASSVGLVSVPVIVDCTEPPWFVTEPLRLMGADPMCSTLSAVTATL